MRKVVFDYVSLFLIFVWACVLLNTDSYYSVYLLLGIVGFTCCYQNRAKEQKKNNWLINIFASFFSLAVVLANYRLFINLSATEDSFGKIFGYMLGGLALFGGFFVFSNILLSIENWLEHFKLKQEPSKSPAKLFLSAFALFSIVYILVMLLCCYPGTLTSDSTDEINQLMTGVYSNHHPFYFTILVKVLISIGLRLFSDINAAVALYSLFQILVMSAAFSYLVVTMYQKGFSKKSLILLVLFFLLMPFNIMYSFTFWKDVLFGCAVLSFSISLYRCLTGISSKKISKLVDSSIVFISSLLICLFRSNGMMAFFVACIFFFVIFGKNYLKYGAIIISALFLGFILKRPVLQALGVIQPDSLESLSIPMQQISRVVVENKDSISEGEKKLISSVVDLDRIAEEYDPIIHDPIKTLVRVEGDKSIISKNKNDYIGLYFSLGFQYPSAYLRAWIDQTKGYWNGGYNYWKWSDGVDVNNYGIEREVKAEPLKRFLDTYLLAFEKFTFLHPFISIGLFVWILLSILVFGIKKKNGVLIFLTVLPIGLWGTLLIATPVFAEFRYIYYLFITLPFLIFVLLASKNKRSWKGAQ